jgi:uncharacterized protein (TIGR02996 family)
MYEDRVALLTAIIAKPEDDGLRLAYADWLDENDRPHRSRLIRRMVAGWLPRGRYPGPYFPYLPRQFPVGWDGKPFDRPFARDSWGASVRHGFIERLFVTSSQYWRFGPAVVRDNPVRHLHLCGTRAEHEPGPHGTPGFWRWHGLPNVLAPLVPAQWEADGSDESEDRFRVDLSDLLIALARDDFRGLPNRPALARPTYTCEVCDRLISGSHLMTIRDSWNGFGEPPPESIVHVYSRRCARRAPEFFPGG